MSTRTKSIFSGMGGLIAALAGLVTVGVGVVTIGSAMGWFDSKKDTGSTTGQNADESTGSGATAGNATPSSPPEFRLDRTEINFAPGGPTEQNVRLTNSGKAPFVPEAAELEGSDPGEFQVTGCAGERLAPGSSCQVKVTFSPSQIGKYDAKVVIPISDSTREAEIEVTGEKGLL